MSVVGPAEWRPRRRRGGRHIDASGARSASTREKALLALSVKASRAAMHGPPFPPPPPHRLLPHYARVFFGAAASSG
jgi:hypothetical protein